MSRRILGEMKALPIEDVEAYIGAQIETLKKAKGRPNSLHMAMSIATYLKDARRWQYVENNGLPDKNEYLNPQQMRGWVDKRIQNG